VAHVFADVEAGDGEHQRVLAGLQQMNQDAEQLVVLLVQTGRVLPPELGGLVHRAPFESTGLHLRGVLVERAGAIAYNPSTTQFILGFSTSHAQFFKFYRHKKLTARKFQAQVKNCVFSSRAPVTRIYSKNAFPSAGNKIINKQLFHFFLEKKVNCLLKVNR